jgi:tRNA pseudouridine65 synthase
MVAAPPFTILEQRDDIIVVDKAADVLVHRTSLFQGGLVLQDLLEEHLGQKVYPVHRLDRKTSGVMLFARNAEAASRWSQRWTDGLVEKRYLAVVRGFTPSLFRIERPLRRLTKNASQEAVTEGRTLGRATVSFSVGPFPRARYSLVELFPQTGRQHQLRRHLNGLNHPILGDTVYGDGRHNRAFREHFGAFRLFLHASSLCFFDQAGEILLSSSAALPWEMRRVCDAFGWGACYSEFVTSPSSIKRQ